MSDTDNNVQQPNTQAPKRICLIDDDPAARFLLRLLLEHHGHQCLEAEQGSPALALLQEGQIVDLILTDNQMPHMNGLEFLKQLHESVPCPPPVIMYSGQLNEDLKQHALQLGAHAVLSKPYTFPEILQAINQALATA
ncbi:response regulator [Nitrospira sp. M1]